MIVAVLLAAAAGSRAQDNSTPSNSNPQITPPQETVVVTGTFEATPETEIDRSVSVLEADTAINPSARAVSESRANWFRRG